MMDSLASDQHALNLARKLRSARLEAGLSQDQVAQKVGLGRMAISAIEVGRRRVAGLELKALAGVYGQPLEHFLGLPGAQIASTADDHAAVGLLTRALRDLTPEDRSEVLRFAEFLRTSSKRSGKS